MPSRVVHFFSDGYRIAADYVLPEGAGSGAGLPGLVLCQGFGGYRSFILPDYAERFAAAGFAVCAFDYRGLGDSEGKPNRIIWSEHTEDIRSALTWLGLQPEVDAGRLGLWGTSGGGAHVVYVAGIDERVKCTVGQVGYGEGQRLVMEHKSPEERERLRAVLRADREQRVLSGESGTMRMLDVLANGQTRDYVQGELNADPQILIESVEAELEHRPIDVAHRIAPRALMLIAAEKDDLCLPEAYKEVFDRTGEPKRWLTYPIGHYEIYAGEWLEKSSRDAIAWFKQHL